MSKDKDYEASLSDEQTFSGKLNDIEPQSLGDQATFAGGFQQRDTQSLGDQATLGAQGGGDAEDAFDSDMEIVDLDARYKVEGVLGKGGMGEVLLAVDTRLNRKVAIKRILGSAARSKTAVNRFLTEAQSIAALNHPNIVQIYDYGRAKDGPFLIMEFVEGNSLLDRCQDEALPLEEAVEITCQLCDGLGKAHSAGIIHRDIKPANVLMTSDGVPKLTDFGLAKAEAADTGMTMAGAVLGTLDFMPPEQRRDALLTDARSDLWSLAASLYQMVTGKSPKIIKFNDVPKALQDVLGKALEDAKEDRYQTASELREALRSCLKDSGQDMSDLGEGQCPHCGTKNDSSRKFCRNCAGSLEAPCLSCAAGMPMWESVCGACGAKQDALLEERKKAMAGQRAQAELLVTDHEYVQALQIARQIEQVSDLRLQQLKNWSTDFINVTEKEQAREQGRAVELLTEALTHEAAYDYPSAIKALEQVPKALQGEKLPGQRESIAKLITRLTKTHNECVNSEKKIRSAIQRRELNGLLPDVERLLKLLPNRADLQKLKDQLIDREQKCHSQRRTSQFGRIGWSVVA